MSSQKGLGLNPKAVKLRYLDRTAEEAGRQKRWGDVSGRFMPKNNVARNVTIEDLENKDFQNEFGIRYPNKYIKCRSERAQLDKLGAIYGLLKGFEGKTFDEFYSAFKTGCSQNSVAAMHVAQHAMEKLHTAVEIHEGIVWGSRNRKFGPRLFQLNKGDYYVDSDGIICRVKNDNLYPPKVYCKRKGFWADVLVKSKSKDGLPIREVKYKYIIGPFDSKRITYGELQSFELEATFSNNIYWKPGHIKIESNVPIDKHYRTQDWKTTYWSPQYYIMLDEAKLQTNPHSLYKNRKPTLCSLGTVIYDEDFVYNE